MRKQVLYEYLGTNGVITSPIHLEDIYYVRKLKLVADVGKTLVKEGTDIQVGSVVIPESEFELWSEVDYSGQE